MGGIQKFCEYALEKSTSLIRNIFDIHLYISKNNINSHHCCKITVVTLIKKVPESVILLLMDVYAIKLAIY